MFVPANHMWILRTSNYASLSRYHTKHVKGRLITEKTYRKSSLSLRLHSKFFPTRPIALFQCIHRLDFVCTQMEHFLHGPGSMKFSVGTTRGFPRTALKCISNPVDCVSVCERLLLPLQFNHGFQLSVITTHA